ncbi:periplasmic heavy metal sensor [Parashewanella spongiae]|uniref:Periplasmic heavy metal sensor n=1 Tax=Parashewanella spongiae TaxID=342950 RepID=A0A3A6TGZ3_9GAMM|nr:Spy/CpxP family protein refolding chaperone [Parashewanella spongiae]MCL1079093.1 Spy/CpxP family protein refolding chaperone [Parashewanella spongiae]RJY10703.1 periplasmic heavy metal sensor [Parashewanella spongiae]
MKILTKCQVAALTLVIGSVAIVPSVIAHQDSAPQMKVQKSEKIHRTHHHGGIHMMKILRKLDLTDEQKQQAKALVKAHKQNTRTIKASIEDRKNYAQKIQALIKADSFDEQSANALIAQRSEQRQQHALNKLKLQHDLYQLLTPEQKQQADEMKQRRHKRRQH